MNLKRANKFLATFILFFSLSQIVLAGELIIFDNPNLVIVRSNDRITGYYGAVEGDKSCEFYLFGSTNDLHKASGEYSYFEIQTFATEWKRFSYAERDRDFDINGRIYRNGSDWIVQTSNEQAGCGGAVGIFAKGLNDKSFRFSEESHISAIAIRVVRRKTFFFDRKRNYFIERVGYLTENDNVVLLEQQGKYSRVRYVNPYFFSSNSGAVTNGWVRSADLVNPFPPAGKEPKQ